MKAFARLQEKVPLDAEGEKLWLMAKGRDWQARDIFRLGLLRFRAYDAIASMSERHAGGVLARTRVQRSQCGKFYLVPEDGINRRVRCESPGKDFGSPSMMPHRTKTFYIQRAEKNGVYFCRFCDGKREQFEFHAMDSLLSVALLTRLKSKNIWMEKKQ